MVFSRYAMEVETRLLSDGSFLGRAYASSSSGDYQLRHNIADRFGDEVETHSHETAHVMLVTGGWYVTEGRGATEPVSCPLIYNPPETTHRDRFCSRGGSFFTVTMSAAATRALTEGDLSPEAVPTLVADPGARSIAHRLSRLCATGSLEQNDLVAESLCLELTAALCVRPPTHRRPPGWLKRLGEILNDRRAEPLVMRDLASEVGVHPIHLARTFRQWHRCTPGDYLRGRRLERAAELLISGGWSVAEVALHSGFADQSHMTRLFSAAYGVPPGRYRRWVRRAA